MKKTPLRSRSAPLRSREPARGKPICKVNRKRKAANLERAHGPAERRSWIKTLPCANCGIVGFSEGAHIKNGGMSRKADARFTIPLCGWHVLPAGRQWMTSCHAAQHSYGWSDVPALDTIAKREAAAARTEELWHPTFDRRAAPARTQTMADEQEIQRELSETDRQALWNVIWLLTRDLTQLNVKVIELKSAIATVERMLDSTGRARQETDNG